MRLMIGDNICVIFNINTPSGERTLSYSRGLFASLLIGDQLLKERICSFWSKFFPLRADSFWKVFMSREVEI